MPDGVLSFSVLLTGGVCVVAASGSAGAVVVAVSGFCDGLFSGSAVFAGPEVCSGNCVAGAGDICTDGTCGIYGSKTLLFPEGFLVGSVAPPGFVVLPGSAVPPGFVVLTGSAV